jgi:sporulation protein YlmC with PRC-barrel domain
MEIKYGAEVVDKDGQKLGSVDHLAMNTWSGDIKSFVVRRKSPASDLFLRPEDVEEANESRIKLRISVDY